MRKIKEGVKGFYERHEDAIGIIGLMAAASAVSYALVIPFLWILKKLGLTDN